MYVRTICILIDLRVYRRSILVCRSIAHCSFEGVDEQVPRVFIPEYESFARESPGAHINIYFWGEKLSVLFELAAIHAERHDVVRLVRLVVKGQVCDKQQFLVEHEFVGID